MQIDWNKYMKDHHIKIYTEEELRKRKLREATHKAIAFCKRHKEDFIKEMEKMGRITNHASET